MSYIFRKAKKQVCFEDFDKNHADLKIRLHYDGLRQNEFFRLMIRKYINKDDNMMKIVESYKEEKGNQSKVNRKKTKQLIEKGKDQGKQFALNLDEVESIFNLLEEEYVEL